MDALVMGALSSLILKLGKVLVGEYKLQKGVKAEIMFLQPELESMLGALEEIADVPADQVDSQDKIWASEVRELSYDIEDSIDTFMVLCNDDGEPAAAGPRGIRLKAFIDRSLELLAVFHNRRRLATNIRGIKRRLVEARQRRETYKLGGVVANKPATVDPRLFAHYTRVTDLVAISDRMDELIKFLGEGGDQESVKKGKIVSIVGFGGLGKTTLANAVYVTMKAQFDCCAFVSVSQTPNINKIFNGLLCDLGKNIQEEYTLDKKRLIDELRGFLEDKRYFIVIDDIWDTLVWKTIRCALPDNKCGYKIITTTRIYDVAEQVGGGVYQMKPLCPRNSKILLYRRIFGCEDNDNNVKCPVEQIDEVSDKILKKCAGVPLAIITIASLLASKGTNKMEWFEVCSSIGVGLESSLDVENMRKILSFSYYGLPSYLRKCLLYLSMFPEDYKISKDRLIWMWIAEDFIEHEKQGKSLFEVGEGYFNELINTSMIQPVYEDYAKYASVVVSCRIHDMILDLVRSLSDEQNFVTTILNNDAGRTSPSKKVIRRICFHNKDDGATSEMTTMGMQQVRSAVVFPPAISLMPPLESFSVLRVLDLEDCDLSEACRLNYLGHLLHLRYLGLRYTMTTRLPEGIGNLKFLQRLDVCLNSIPSFPSTIVQLRHLTCLNFDGHTSLPSGIGRLASLEELSLLQINGVGSTGLIEEVGNLTQLRVLGMTWNTEWNDSLERCVVECLNKLRKLRYLNISSVIFAAGALAGGVCKCNLDGWVAPPHLSKLELGYWSSTLPDWINPSLQDLWFLVIRVMELRQEDFQILGRLPALRYLDLKVDHGNLGVNRRFTVVGDRSFPCLQQCRLLGFGAPIKFRCGAMPRLNTLHVQFSVHEIAGSSDGDFGFGLGNLESLQSLTVRLKSSGGASQDEAERSKAAVSHTMEIHPNHPSYSIYIDGNKVSGSDE
ncbi:hypothetical protein BS78_05G016400 [Paspalum vaginatum]|nr:hypothetical protein BS78_05G016400 [Paspalum vaginatum]KAJ1273850.1 hypothetical protein BS78_05G016400 [Paspalum vaginatum]